MKDIDLGNRYYPKSFEEKVDPAHTAVIVVDMQNEFCSPEGYVARQGWDVRPMRAMALRLRNFVDAARMHVRVIHVRGQYEPAVMPPQMVERLHRFGIPPYCQPGTKGVDFYPGFEPVEGDIVITKRTFSAFAHTELEHVLRNLRIQTVVVTGTFSNVCVDSTVRDAYFRGFYPVIPDDLTATSDPEVHRMTMATLGHFFGVVVRSEEILKTWAQLDTAQVSRGHASA
jgi:nicotinamidase-related amidase